MSEKEVYMDARTNYMIRAISLVSNFFSEKKEGGS